MRNSHLIRWLAIGSMALGSLALAGAPEAQGERPALDPQRAFALNADLEALDAPVRLAKIEFLLSEGSQFMGGKTTFFKDVGNRNLPYHWVKGDERRGGFSDIAYLTDLIDGFANDGNGGFVDPAVTTAVIEQGMANWDGIPCATLPITNLGAIPLDLGLTQFLVGMGGFPGWFADITHAGWLPPEFFEIIGGPGGGAGILGATLTYTWSGPTDINNDGKADTALAEIYMNNNFAWEVGNAQGSGYYDIQETMFHEQGHSLSQGHFGEISLNNQGKLIISPKRGTNLMLAAGGSNSEWQGFHGTDTGGHCSIWGDW